jgi:membrane-associated protease RseP (regulator of RpoE activity)
MESTMFTRLMEITRSRRAVLALAALVVSAPLSGAAAQRADGSGSGTQRQERPWFGFSIGCTECTMTETPDEVRWTFSVPPEIIAIEEGSPAHVSGMRVGDIVTHVDGLPVTGRAGQDRLTALRAGAVTTLGVLRTGRGMEVRVIAGVHPQREFRGGEQAPAVDATTAAASTQPLRFSGDFGDMSIAVRGPANTTVTFADRECWMEIRVADAVVRLVNREGCRSPR